MSKRPTDRSPRGERPSRGPRKTGFGKGPAPKRSFGDRPPRRDDDAPSRSSHNDGARDDRRGPSDRRSGASSGRGTRPPRRDGDAPPRPSREGGSRDERRGLSDRRSGPPSDRGGRPPRRDDGAPSRPSRASGPRDDRRSPSDRRSGPTPDRPSRPSFRDRDDRSGRPPKAGQGSFGSAGPSRPYAKGGKPDRNARPEKPWKRQSRDERTFREGDPLTRRPFRQGERSNRFSLPNPDNDGLIRLNRYLAQAGVASRREADLLISTGAVTVNGVVVTQLGTKIKPDDLVHFGAQKLSIEQKRYVLLNKPKDTITTTDDPQDRHTVMSLIAKACTERLYPVGRLDRNTTGVLLLTNDGDLAKKLTHPSHGAEKIYHVTLDKSVSASHLQELVNGIILDDGPAQADEASYVAASESRREVGIKLHIGRNRIVRRMFAALGYEVVKLDRVLFAGLTKKDLQRSHWRHLTDKEVTLLKRTKDAPASTKEERGGRRTRLSQGSE